MNLDGLKRLLGMATKGAGQAAKAVMPMAMPLQGAAKLMGKPMGQLQAPREARGFAPMNMQPSQDNMITNQMVDKGQLPESRREWMPQMYSQDFRPQIYTSPGGMPTNMAPLPARDQEEDIRRSRLNEAIGMPYGDYTVPNRPRY